MSLLNRIVCFLRGHEWRHYEITRYNFGSTCLRCGRIDRPMCRKGGAS